MRWHDWNPLRAFLAPRRRLSRTRPQLEPLEALILPSTGAGAGLVADFFSDTNLTNLVATRTDPAVNFDWAGAAPAAGVAPNNFSVRWAGQVQAQFSETYTFFTQSTHGVRLWVNGQELVNDWTDHALTEDSGTITLQAGQTYSIRMEYQQTGGDDVARLLWASPSTPKQVIPTGQLYANSGWLDGDVGAPAAAGSVASAGSVFTVRGGGVSQAAADQGNLAYQTLNGDGTVVARVTGVGSAGAAAAAGVMIRDGLGAGADFAAVVLTPGGSAAFQYRTAPGAAASQATLAGAAAPYWVKLVRNGNVLDGYVSATGADGSWQLVGTANVPMGRTVEVGLWTTSGAASALNAATFDNVSVAPAVPVGANLGAVNDYSLDNAFVDLTKPARAFTSLARPVQAAYVDVNGWPTEDFQVIFQDGSAGTAKVYNGTYKLSFTGQASVSPSFTPGGSITNLVYNAATNTTTADFTVNAGATQDGWYVVLNFTNTHGGVQNLKLIRPGYDPNTTQVFTNQFLAEVAPFSVLRTMDFTQTNNNPVVNWSDRAQVTDATQSTAKGVAWEYVIALANAAHKDLWINIPEGATDDYVKQLAALIKQQLAPGLVVYVEYSNELWNSSFSQFNANLQAAVAEVTAGMASGTPSNLFYSGETAKNADGSYVSQYDWAWRRIARRVEQISADFASVWGAAAINNQVRPVLASQMSNPYILQTGLQFLQNTYGAPSQYLYAVAGAPYFNLGGQDSQTNLTTDQVLAALSASMAQQSATYPAYAALATYYGLHDYAYEGGPDTFGPNNVAAKAAASLDPRMEAVVSQYLQNWFAAGGGLFNWYLAGPTNYNTAYGTWGLTNDVTNLNTPKMLGIDDALAAPTALAAGYGVPGVISANNYVGAAPTTNPYPRYLHDGATLDYVVQAPQAGTYNLQINYAATAPNEQLQILVNDNVVTTLTLAVTGPDYDSQYSPDDFADSPAVALHLNQGLNVVRLKVVVEGYTINQLKFSAPAQAQIQGPTVAAAAGAVLNAAGAAASLTVLGADPAGESGLTYTWSVLAAPAGAPAPAFAANGTNAAKNTTVTFGAAGAYTLQAVIRDAAGLSAASSVNVVVGQLITSVAVAPASVSLAAGASLQFTAAAKDQFGAAMASPPTFTWTVRGSAGGTVSAGGLYTASAAGGGVDTVTASAGGLAGSGAVTVASATPPTINFANGFSSTTGLKLNGSAQAVNGRLRLTNGQGWQGGSAYYATRVGVASFSTTFSFQLTNANADGFAFVIQGTGPTPVGAYGSGLGYVGVPHSVAIRFDLNNDTGAGNNATGLSVNGAMPASPTDLGKSGIDLHSGHTFNVAVTYNGTTLVVTITDAVTGASASQSYAVNIPAVVGASTAYVGFSGATGNQAATQDILNWAFYSHS